MATSPNHLQLFDPNSNENPPIQPLMLMRPDTGEIITPERARQERVIAKATSRRTIDPIEWGPQHLRDKFDIHVPDEMIYST